MFDWSSFLERPALQDENGILTYAQVQSEASKATIPQGSLCLLLCTNTIDCVLCYICCLQNRIPVILCDSELDLNRLKVLIKTYNVNAVLAPQSFDQEQLDFVAQSKRVFFGYSLIFLNSAPPACHKDLCVLLSTSGSTGSEKLVRLSWQNLKANAVSIASYLKIKSFDKTLLFLPLNYSFGLSIVNSYLLQGALVVLCPYSIMQRNFWQMLKDMAITSLSGVPYSFDMLVRLGFLRQTYPSLATITQAGGHLNAKRQEAVARYCQEHGISFYVMYGQTEASARISYLDPALALSKLGSVGQAIPGGRMYVIDDRGHKIDAPHKEGELVYEGENVCLGYAQSAADLSLGDENLGHLKTGDLAYFDEDGDFYITGRKKRFIKLFGNRISLAAVEELLAGEFSDLVCAAAGEDDRLKIVLEDPQNLLASETLSAIKAYLVSTLKVHGSAIEVKTVSQLPKSASGKILFDKLKEL